MWLVELPQIKQTKQTEDVQTINACVHDLHIYCR